MRKEGTVTTEEERIFKGELFASEVPELVAKKLKAHRLSQEYSQLFEEDAAERDRILHELLASIGEGTFMLGPIRFHYGCHTRVGSHCFMNFNFTVQDDACVTIGNHCNFGPDVTIVTPMHPMLPEERRGLVCSDGEEHFLCYAKPVVIGDDCWFGANVVVCPGVTIGEGCVIGAGSVVTRDIPARSFAAGSPARVIRPITEETDAISIAVPSDVQQYLDEVRENADAAVTQSASSALAVAMADPERYIHDNKELLEQYRAVAESEEYKASPAYRLQEYLKQFQSESGYNDVFIPAMQRLSPAYREYHKSLQAANEVFLRHFQQE